VCLPLSAFAGLSSPNLIISWHRYPLPRSAQRWSISRSEVRPLGRCGASFGQERADRLPTCLWPLLPSPRRRARVLPTPRRLPSTPVQAARLRHDHQLKLPGAPGLAFALNGLSSLWRVFTVYSHAPLHDCVRSARTTDPLARPSAVKHNYISDCRKESFPTDCSVLENGGAKQNDVGQICGCRCADGICRGLHSSASAITCCRICRTTAATGEGLRLPFDGTVQLPRT